MKGKLKEVKMTIKGQGFLSESEPEQRKGEVKVFKREDKDKRKRSMDHMVSYLTSLILESRSRWKRKRQRSSSMLSWWSQRAFS